MLKALHVLEEETSGLAVAISTSLRRVVYVCGDEIIREGASSDALYFIAAGKVNVMKRAAARQSVGQPAGYTGSGNDQEAPLTSLGAGTLFGEIPLLPAPPWANPTLILITTTTPAPTPNPSPNPNPNLHQVRCRSSPQRLAARTPQSSSPRTSTGVLTPHSQL